MSTGKRGKKVKFLRQFPNLAKFTKSSIFFLKYHLTHGAVCVIIAEHGKVAMIPEVAEIRIWAAGSSGGAVSDFKLDETELS